MRISAKAEYACVAMLELAASFAEPQPLRIKAIAEAQGIPPRFLVQILLQLKTAGLVVSVRGASGGYQLARPPEEITLAAVINAIDDRALTPRSALSEARRSPRRRRPARHLAGHASRGATRLAAHHPGGTRSPHSGESRPVLSDLVEICDVRFDSAARRAERTRQSSTSPPRKRRTSAPARRRCRACPSATPTSRRCTVSATAASVR